MLRFFSGGSNSVRGFGSRSLGLLEVTGDRVRPLGGNWYYETSLEARLRFGEWVGLVAFADAGDVEGGAIFPEIVVGGGLRVFTSFGPIRFDFGWRLTPQADRCATGPLGTGACPAGTDGPWQIFLSLGQAF